MNNIFFKPWIGKNFRAYGYRGLKLLILGESHYCEIENVCATCGTSGLPGCRNFTNGTVEEFLEYKSSGQGFKYWMNTYTRFGNVLENQMLGSDATRNLWDSIAFYNYAQIAVTNKRIAPSTEVFRASEDAFRRVLADLTPDLIIVWGKRLWQNLPATGRDAQAEGIQFYVYTLQNGLKIPAMHVNHPSSSHFGYEAHAPLAQAMKLSVAAKKPSGGAQRLSLWLQIQRNLRSSYSHYSRTQPASRMTDFPEKLSE